MAFLDFLDPVKAAAVVGQLGFGHGFFLDAFFEELRRDERRGGEPRAVEEPAFLEEEQVLTACAGV